MPVDGGGSCSPCPLLRPPREPRAPHRSMLEASHRKIVHLGKLADIQMVHHGVPLHGAERSGPPLPPREEALVAFSQMLLAFHLDPTWADEELTATLTAAAAGVRASAPAHGRGL